MAWKLVINKKVNQEYEGPAEVCEYKFSVPLPDQLGAKWTAEQMINAHIEKLGQNGGKLLELYLWEDKSPTFQTNYYARVVSTASPIPWAVIIVGVLIILGLATIAYIITKIEHITKYIGDKAPVAIPIIAIGAIGLLFLAGMMLGRKAE